jgi:hypothetical protein
MQCDKILRFFEAINLSRGVWFADKLQQQQQKHLFFFHIDQTIGIKLSQNGLRGGS